MITRLSHVTLYVLDQEAARDFYTSKLGFEVRTDSTLEGFRWLTLGVKSQPDLEIVLMPITPNPMMDEATCTMLTELLAKGVLGGGVLNTDNCQKTYDELKAKGVNFITPPTERPYGIEAVLKDNSGNWFSMCQHG
jgi:catechol 2,3-dioxygenase-like lactoylglutathione lyase family enzyme